MKNILISKDELYDLYVNQNLSIHKIARMKHTSDIKISGLKRKFSIPWGRKVFLKKCIVCKKKFNAPKTAKYCSLKCKNIAHKHLWKKYFKKDLKNGNIKKWSYKYRREKFGTLNPYAPFRDIIMNTLGRKCSECGKTRGKLILNHKKYGKNITINDVNVLCDSCHKETVWGK